MALFSLRMPFGTEWHSTLRQTWTSFTYIFLLLTSTTLNAEIYKCKDSSGRVSFTDNQKKCNDASVKQIQINGHVNEIVNFRHPKRQYSRSDGKYQVYYETSMKSGDPELLATSVNKLTSNLDTIFQKLPEPAVNTLKGIDFYLMWGPDSPQGGEKSGMRYISPNGTKSHSAHDSQWQNAIIIYSAKNLMYLSDLWSKKALTHELAHAWHLLNWSSKEEKILNPWLNARSASLYQSVKSIDGKNISPAYASKNQLEYFAELSAIYFVGGNYFPFDKEGLKTYDFEGYQMVEYFWRTTGDTKLE